MAWQSRAANLARESITAWMRYLVANGSLLWTCVAVTGKWWWTGKPTNATFTTGYTLHQFTVMSYYYLCSTPMEGHATCSTLAHKLRTSSTNVVYCTIWHLITSGLGYCLYYNHKQYMAALCTFFWKKFTFACRVPFGRTSYFHGRCMFSLTCHSFIRSYRGNERLTLREIWLHFMCE